jgi:Mycolic acid cyclopropane synthetase
VISEARTHAERDAMARTAAEQREHERGLVAEHYQHDPEIFSMVLDRRLAYATAVFDDPLESLDVAQERKYARIAAKLAIQPGEHVLDRVRMGEQSALSGAAHPRDPPWHHAERQAASRRAGSRRAVGGRRPRLDRGVPRRRPCVSAGVVRRDPLQREHRPHAQPVGRSRAGRSRQSRRRSLGLVAWVIRKDVNELARCTDLAPLDLFDAGVAYRTRVTQG